MRYFKSLTVPGDQLLELEHHGGNGTQKFAVTFDNGFNMGVFVRHTEMRVSLYNNVGTLASDEEISGTSVEGTYTLTSNEDTYQLAILRGAHESLTKEDISLYRKEGGVRCPFCRTTDIHAGRFESQEDGVVIQHVECASCDASWKDEYKLIQIVTSGEDAWTGPTENVIRDDDSEES